MISTRPDEPEYAKLFDPATLESNRYGNKIKLTEVEDNGASLCINGDLGIGDNPNRTKQHAFHFTADNCIGCHACEAACSEKNDLPVHISFRSVGYVEGGTYPNFTRMNISMACNHCDDPVCLKGCPTRAYTKHPEYGAVIQDPDICFGCGYCTWVCPYNAPQLDPVEGHVEKCNMCVDRLEVGLKPACVSACLGDALDFGVVENTPAGKDQIETTLPGFPDPSITQPNIRFQQSKKTPAEFTRTDSAPIKYHQDAATGEYRPQVDEKLGRKSSWNLARLSSRENPLVLFTILTQAAIGGFVVALAAGAAQTRLPYLGLLVGLLAMVGVGLLMSTVHLGKPVRFYRGFNNLRHSPVSREGLATVIFGGSVFLHGAASLTDVTAAMAPGLGIFAAVAGAATLVFMIQCYLIKARPFWNHLQTVTSFIGAALHLGGWISALYLYAVNGSVSNLAISAVAIGLSIELIGLVKHRIDMLSAEHEGAASYYVQTTTFGKSYWLRNALLALGLGLTAAWSLGALPDAALLAAALLTMGATLMGRALFYVLVIPTTMPGAFFWKNKAFEEHARDIGLADNPNAGVAPLGH